MKNYLILINLLFLTAASYLGVSSFYQLVGAKLEVVSPSVGSTKKAAAPVNEPIQPLDSYAVIQKRNLFRLTGEPETASIPANVEIETLKETDLQLKLWGTVTGNDQIAYAVIEDTKQRMQQLYHVEDGVQNAIVKEIHREKVVLEVDGNFEVLQMEKIEGRPTGRAGARQATRRRTQSPGTSEPKKITLKRERIESAINDLGSLMKQVRIRPHYKDGQSDGLTLSGIRSNSIFSEMGFRNGDVITGVDGKNIESVDDALSLYENLQSADRVQVQIRRRGRLQTIDYQVE
jgi:general secretion pathway protein C